MEREINRMKDGGKASDQPSGSFVMSPHPNDFHNSIVFENLVDKPMLNIDPSRIRSSQIASELFGIFLSLFRINKRPFHQESSGEHFSTGVFKPRTIDSRILGIESKYNVSWIARHSSIEMRTPAFFFPTM